MRTLFYIFILLCFAHSSSAQKIRFTDTSNQWTTSWSEGVSFTRGIDLYTFKGYSIANGQTYNRINNFSIREDSNNNIVYFLLSSGVETMLYNYNLKIGDTVSRHVNNLGTYIHQVSKIDSININGYWHKVWTLSPANSAFAIVSYKIIEGIGCTRGLDFPLAPLNFEAGTSLICFTNNNQTIYAPPYLTPEKCKLSVSNTTSQNHNITISPNPANENSVIKLPYKLQSGMLVIINTVGQAVSQKEIQNKEQVILGTLPVQGLYIYRVTDKQSNQSFTGKFVYE